MCQRLGFESQRFTSSLKRSEPTSTPLDVAFGTLPDYLHYVSAQEIISELPKLSQNERRAIVREIFELEPDAQTLADCDARADQNFLMLDEIAAGKPG